jgi:D-serine deaminase-like pyridoxal phosphate-dependent protein
MGGGLVVETRERIQREYGGAIGRRLAHVTTPALLLDLPAARRNIDRMADGLARLPAALRPHMKAHKSPDLALLQAAAGARGFSTATVWEAIVLAEVGLDDLFVVNTIAGPAAVRRLAELARERHVLVAFDDADNARSLSDAAVRAGSRLGAMIEVDTGMDRAGVDDAGSAVSLAGRIADMPGLVLKGVTGYEGHCSMEDDVALRGVKQRAAMEVLLGAAEAIRGAGLPCGIVSAGGTRTWWMTAATAGVTEIQAGTYALMDRFHAGIEGGFEPALRVLTTVISRPPGRLIVDAGSKSVADPDLAVIVGSDASVVRFDEEHGIFVRHGDSGPGVGDVVELVPGYAPSTVNFYDAYHVVEDDRVVDVWPIVPRGPGHHGLAA